MGKLLAVPTVFCIAMVLFGINRGFDISDEGLYVLLADPLQQNSAGIFNYDLFFKFIYRVSGYSFSLPELRIIRLLSYLAGAWALTGFWKNIKNEPTLKLEIFGISALGLMAGYAFLPPTLSYNSIAVVLICFWLRVVSNLKTSVSGYLILGLILSLLGYSKVTLVFLFLPMTILAVWKKLTFPNSILLFIPFLLFELLFIVFFGENALTRLSDGVAVTTQRPDYQFDLLIKSVTVGCFWILISGLLFFLPGYLKKKESKIYNLSLFLATTGIAWIGYITHITEEWNHLILLFIAGLFGFALGLEGFKSNTPKIWIGLLLLLPFLMHFGSNVYWLRIGIHYGVFWILGFLLLVEKFKKNIFLLTSLISVLLVFNGIWWHPFGQDLPLWSEKKSWVRKEPESLLIDPELVNILERLKETEMGETSKPYLAAYRIPGLVWLSSRQLPLSPGIWDKSQLNSLFESKPEKMIYNSQDSLPGDWTFLHRQELGVYQGDTLMVLWD